MDQFGDMAVLGEYLGEFGVLPTNPGKPGQQVVIPVSEVQAILQGLGYKSSAITDGDWGPTTAGLWKEAAAKRKLDGSINRAGQEDAWVMPDTHQALQIEATHGAAPKTTPKAPSGPPLISAPVDELQLLLRTLGNPKDRISDGKWGPTSKGFWEKEAKARGFSPATSGKTGAKTAKVVRKTLEGLQDAATEMATARKAGKVVGPVAPVALLSAPVQELQLVLRTLGNPKTKISDGKWGPTSKAFWEKEAKARALNPATSGKTGAKTASVVGDTFQELQAAAADMATARKNHAAAEAAFQKKAAEDRAKKAAADAAAKKAAADAAAQQGAADAAAKKAAADAAAKKAAAAKRNAADVAANQDKAKTPKTPPKKPPAKKPPAKKPKPKPTEPIKQGMQKQSVEAIQQALIQLGWKPTTALTDKKWGPTTATTYKSEANRRKLDPAISRASAREAWVMPATFDAMMRAAAPKRPDIKTPPQPAPPPPLPPAPPILLPPPRPPGPSPQPLPGPNPASVATASQAWGILASGLESVATQGPAIGTNLARVRDAGLLNRPTASVYDGWADAVEGLLDLINRVVESNTTLRDSLAAVGGLGDASIFAGVGDQFGGLSSALTDGLPSTTDSQVWAQTGPRLGGIAAKMRSISSVAATALAPQAQQLLSAATNAVGGERAARGLLQKALAAAAAVGPVVAGMGKAKIVAAVGVAGGLLYYLSKKNKSSAPGRAASY